MNTRTEGSPASAENAILVIDMQNDWLSPSSPVYNPNARATLPAIARFLDYGRARGWAIIYIYRTHRASGIDAELFRRHYFEEGRPYCLPGSKGAEIADEIAPLPEDIKIDKKRFSGFMGTDLEIILRRLGAKNIFITGTQYPNCIRATAVDSMSRDYNTTVLTDCCSAMTKEVADANIYDMRNMGIPCVPSEEVMERDT